MKSSNIGGQAVLEGVMMKNQEKYAVAVRKPDGKIEVKTEEYKSIAGESKFLKLPFIRGVFNFCDSLILGTRCLNYSASFYEDEDMEKTKTDKVVDKVSDGNSESVLSVITVIISMVIAIALFMVLPYFLAELLKVYVRNASLLALIEALIRVAIFLIYVVAISLMKDIRRVYMYHGAEHKCINCIERGRELNVENVKKSSRLHRRCGTSFLLFVVFVSAVVFFFIRVDQPVLRVGLRILLIPVIAGISYEIIRLAGRSENPIVKLISAPGLALQKLTTREPDEAMIEVAIKSVEAVFDWRAFLGENFDYEEYKKGSEKETVTEEADEAEKTVVEETLAEEAVVETEDVAEETVVSEEDSEE